MSGNKKLVLLRLQKQQKKLNDQPLEQAWVAREGVLNFHFCIYGLDGAYEGGFYHGLLELSQEYPFAPPKLLFFTPSGRFQVEKSVCTTFTNFHKESWSSGWNIRTMVMATISFMTSDQQGAGSIKDSYLSKRSYARNSLQHNMKNPLFVQLFKRQIHEYRIKPKPNPKPEQQQKGTKGNDSQSLHNMKLYALYSLLVICLLGWIYYKM